MKQRKKPSKVVAFRVSDDDLLDHINTYAKEEDRKRGNMLVVLLREAVKARQGSGK